MALITRRTALAAFAGACSVPVSGHDSFASQGLALGPEQAFSFDTLITAAHLLSLKPYVPPVIPGGQLLERIDYDQHMDIAFRPDRTIWADSPTPIRLFHPHKFAKEPVRIFLVENGSAREVLYRGDLFTFGPKAAFAKSLPSGVGFTGFRVLNPHDVGDWLAFEGASYFRASGELDQYGLSARGIAIDTGLDPEEFPRFTSLWLERRGDGIAIHALLDGPSLTGAYRMLCRKDRAVIMDIDARLFFRKNVQRLGIAPLTTMFWYSELNKAGAPDWRPEVHDSDGLALWTGSGERLWRPLNNPVGVMTNSFLDNSPGGFGLLQRDRNFADYEDDGVFYDKRPTTWVEPLAKWGEGAVQLVEIQTDSEIHDNVVAYWVPKLPPRAGDALSFAYRLYWTAAEPFPPRVARVVNSWRGRGGRPAEVDKEGLVKYVIDFEGGDISHYRTSDPIEPVITVSRGEVRNPYAVHVNTTPKWRVVFDLKAEGPQPVDIRAFLRKASGEALTETWLCQHPAGVTTTVYYFPEFVPSRWRRRHWHQGRSGFAASFQDLP